MEYLIEDCDVFTPNDYMYIDDYEHPMDYIHRIYHETIRRIHLMELEKRRHLEREEVDVQIYPDTCICCRNHWGKPDEIKIARNVCKNSETQDLSIASKKSRNQSHFNKTESITIKSNLSKSNTVKSESTISNTTKSNTTNSNITKSNQLKLTPTKSTTTEFNPTGPDSTGSTTTKLDNKN